MFLSFLSENGPDESSANADDADAAATPANADDATTAAATYASSAANDDATAATTTDDDAAAAATYASPATTTNAAAAITTAEATAPRGQVQIGQQSQRADQRALEGKVESHAERGLPEALHKRCPGQWRKPGQRSAARRQI